MKNEIFTLAVAILLPVNLFSQIGVNTPTPQKTLHVNGSLQFTNELNVGGNASTAGNAGTTGQVLRSNGPGVAPTWQDNSNIVVPPNSPGGTEGTGTIIAVNGQLQVAQEIVVRLATSWTMPVAASAADIAPIQQLADEVIDNRNAFTGTATTNGFTVDSNGTYLISMSFSLQVSTGTAGGNFRFGIIDATTNTWVSYSLETMQGYPAGQLFSYSSLRASNLVTGRTYRFAIQRNPTGSSGSVLIRALENTAGTGGIDLPMTLFSVKRLK